MRVQETVVKIPCPTPCKQCLPVSHGPVVYRCAKELSINIGVSINAIYKALSATGSTERCGKARGGRLGNVKPVTIGKHSWPSVSKMARETGGNRSTICKQLKHDPQKVLVHVMRWEREKENLG